MNEITVHPATSGDYPTAYRHARPDYMHGHIVQDPYRWLETSSSSETRGWLAAQEGLAGEFLTRLPGTGALRRRIAELYGAGTISTPIWRGARYFFTRRSTGQNHPVLYVATSPRDERILIDPNAIDPSAGTTLDGWCPDWEGRLLAYQLSAGGTEQAELRVMDVAARTDVGRPIDRCRYSDVAWLNDGLGFYYSRLNPRGQWRVYLHRIGTPAADDVLIFGRAGDGSAAGARSRLSVAVSGDARWLIIGAITGTAHGNALWLADLTACEAAAPAFRPVQRDLDARTRARVGRDGRLYLLTDWQAPRGRLAVASPGASGPGCWHDLLAEDPEAVLKDFAILDGEGGTAPVLLAVRTRHAVSEITVHDLDTGARLAEVPLPGLGTVTALSERPEGGQEAWFAYTDISTPPTILRYDARHGPVSVWERAPGTVTVPGVTTRLVGCRSADGTIVRTLVTAATADQDSNRPVGPRPAILEGYGGFGISLTPRYSPALLAWVEAGGVYAYASLRGGGEEGEGWHSAATRGHKQRTFDDFTAAAAELIASGWTSADRLAIRGGSNGGLLVAVAVTQQPELFAAALCDSPITDMIRYERFGLGALWTEEYGSADDPADFATLMSYSPYHNVRPGTEYPAVLFLASDADTRVDPLHARKMCAALQHATAAPWPRRPILLRREAGTGHSARATGRSVSAAAEALAFLAYHTDLNFPGGS